MRQIANDLFFQTVEAELAEGRNVRFRLKGTSMTPFLRNGRDEVLVTPPGSEELCKGDVVLFRYRGRHILHRIVGKEGSRFLLRGDGVCRGGEVCTLSDIVGVVRRVYRSSGREVSTASLRWRLSGWLWGRLPLICRRIFLRLYYFCLQR